mmetsp:Transcript_2464/g.5521  ORF Transcript_2464/g.5521 Transcript_2464/m.5521 type:complete len:233 (+) Transcript_2464:1387-2085(+)
MYPGLAPFHTSVNHLVRNADAIETHVQCKFCATDLVLGRYRMTWRFSRHCESLPIARSDDAFIFSFEANHERVTLARCSPISYYFSRIMSFSCILFNVFNVLQFQISMGIYSTTFYFVLILHLKIQQNNENLQTNRPRICLRLACCCRSKYPPIQLDGYVTEPGLCCCTSPSILIPRGHVATHFIGGTNVLVLVAITVLRGVDGITPVTVDGWVFVIAYALVSRSQHRMDEI